VPGDGRVVLGARVADVDELGGVELQLLAHGLGEGEGLVGGGQDRAVLWGDGVDPGGGDPAGGARHVARHDGRLARDVLAHVAGDEARVGIVAAPGRVADHEADRLALVELLDRLRAGRAGEKQRRAAGQKTGRNNGAAGLTQVPVHDRLPAAAAFFAGGLSDEP
jgi:hypothetical protein